MSGDAKILEQQVARENIRGRQFLDGMTVFSDRRGNFLPVTPVDQKVQWFETAFDINMPENNHIIFK